MKAATYDYAKPLTCDEAIALIVPTGGMGKFVSGSQSLGPMMNLRLAQPEMLVDLRGIAALRACRIEGETVTLGACITHAQIESAPSTETNQIIQKVAPSFNFPRPTLSDGTDSVRPATLRGLGPDQVLVMLNGKRRHTSALVNVNGTVGRGSLGSGGSAC